MPEGADQMVKNKRYLTDRYLRSVPPAPKGKRDEVWDTVIPGFGLRIGDAPDAARPSKAAKIIFVLYARFTPGSAPARRTIGTFGGMSLEQGRRIAGEWRSMIDRGIDPAAVEAERIARERREAVLRERHSFAAVAEAFITNKLARERKGKPVERDLRAFFIKAWGDRPISEITDLDALEIINKKKRTAPQMARHLLTIAKRLFNWAVDQRVYGLKSSPCDRLIASKIIGEKVSRHRRLTDAEIFAFWRATALMPYPVGPAYQMLILTGLRLYEAADISWPEIKDSVLTVPASRMKSREHKAKEHIVPLPKLALDIIDKLPRGNAGPYLFSYSGGETPLRMTSKIKRDLDRRMLRTLKALARQQGEDPRNVKLTPWVNHDLRRTIRSALSALRIPQNVAEAVLGHVPPGIIGTYDTHEYLDEKREALELWAKRLDLIVNPDQVGNVVALRR
jgi:integrase